MSDPKIHQANLQLLIDLREHLATADRLRKAYEQLLALASAIPHRPTNTTAKAVHHAD